MDHASPEIRNLARRLVGHEARNKKSPASGDGLSFPSWEKLRPPLADMVGRTGANALLGRALVLSRPEVAWLSGMQVTTNGVIEGMDEVRTQVSPGEIADGRAVLLAQIIGLLNTLIGSNLTAQLLREVWPDLHLGSFNVSRTGRSAPGETHEIDS